MLEHGTQIEHRYQVVRKVGEGAMAEVYEVQHMGLQSRHALKVLDSELAADDDLRNRFLAEGRIQAQLQHAHIVSVTDIVTDPVPGLVMEFVDGPPLDEYLKAQGGPLDAANALALMLPVLDAVGHAHANGIVHRDLKPENILVGRDARGNPVPKVADFGIAKVLEGTQLTTGKRRTEMGTRVGTLLYMSPEQIRGSSELDARSDIFALGAILYEVVTGRVAFDAPSEYDTMSRIVEGTFEPPERVIGGMDPVFAACVRKALAVDPAQRFPDCRNFRDVLSSGGRPGAAPLPNKPDRSFAVTGPPTPVVPGDTPPPAGGPPPGPAPGFAPTPSQPPSPIPAGVPIGTPSQPPSPIPAGIPMGAPVPGSGPPQAAHGGPARCPQCGVIATPGVSFCESCGTEIEAARVPLASEPAPGTTPPPQQAYPGAPQGYPGGPPVRQPQYGQPQGYGGYQDDYQPGKLPPDPGANPVLALCINLLCICGVGQMINGQVGKGVVILLVHGILGALTGVSIFITWPIACIDAYLIGKKRQQGRWVGTWEWF